MALEELESACPILWELQVRGRPQGAFIVGRGGDPGHDGGRNVGLGYFVLDGGEWVSILPCCVSFR
jgi:hypothetical protein